MEKKYSVSCTLRLMHIMMPTVNEEKRLKFNPFDEHKIWNLTVVVMRVTHCQIKSSVGRRKAYDHHSLYTILLSRVHEHIQQAGEMIFVIPHPHWIGSIPHLSLAQATLLEVCRWQ